MQGTLFVVGVPIGNLEDITLRALRVLRECNAVLCEDTRVTRKLLTHHGITTPLISYHEYSGDAKYEKIVARLTEGESLTLVSDAGTPSISDPGARLVAHVRAHLPEVRTEVVPGPSALTAALSVAGVSGDSFLFLGFPPHKKGRKTFFEDVGAESRTVVMYESPHRIMKALDALVATVTPTRTVVVCRELTKVYEEVVQGTASEVHAHFLEHPDRVRGEFVVIVV